jgi:uncharacterized protein
MGESAFDGGTVLVTGASSGIGMAIARLVAPRAKTLILVARRIERLEDLKRELVKARSDLRVEPIPCDLSSREEVAKLIASIEAKELAVDVLVNNAGIGMMGFYESADPAKVTFMIDLNVTSLSLLTQAFLPGMVKRGRGGILNISSGFGLGTLPMFAAYAATKHYVTGFTEGLQADLAGTGVVVTQVCPGPVATEFEQAMGNTTGQKVPGFIEITADHCARSSVRAFDRGRAMVVPGITMKIVMLINALSPRFVRRVFAGLVGRYARKKQLGAPVL